MEEFEHVVVIDDFINDLQAHVVKLECSLKKLLLCLSTYLYLGFFRPVLVRLTTRPIEGRLVEPPHFLFNKNVVII